MRNGVGRIILRGLVVAGVVAGALTLYRHEWGRPSFQVAQPAAPDPTSAPQQVVPNSVPRALSKDTIDLGNLSVIGTGGPPRCAPDVAAPWVLTGEALHRPTEEICDAIKPLRRTIRKCLHGGLEEGALGGDFVALRLSVGKSGRVESLFIEDAGGAFTSHAGVSLDKCLQRALHPLRFAPGETDKISVEMNLF